MIGDCRFQIYSAHQGRGLYQIQSAIFNLQSPIFSVKELLSTLTIDERYDVMLEFEDLLIPKSFLNWWQMRHSGLSGWRKKVDIAYQEDLH
jgi:hypothetical protein